MIVEKLSYARGEELSRPCKGFEVLACILYPMLAKLVPPSPPGLQLEHCGKKDSHLVSSCILSGSCGRVTRLLSEVPSIALS